MKLRFAAFLALVCAGLLIGNEFSLTSLASGSTTPRLRLGAPLPENLFVELAKTINPAVVNISTLQTVRRRSRGLGNDPFFDLFEQFMMPGLAQPRQSLGTGFIIRPDGLLITNNHVIEGADQIRVQLSENEKDVHQASVVGRDARTDIALIKIKAPRPLAVATLGSSSDLQVGEWVLAAGNPFGHGHSVTKGIVSAIGRRLDEINRFPFIQTDASINPGNSGGPLVNTKGLVVGVNTAIDARAQGIGFAIPIDAVKQLLGPLEKDGRIKRGYLGLSLMDIDGQGAATLGLKDASGALVTQIAEGSPAAKAGFAPYDFVVQIGDKTVDSARTLMNAISDLTVGERVTLKFIRDGRPKTVTAKIEEHPEDRARQQAQTLEVPGGGLTMPFNLGFKVTDITPALQKKLGLPTLNRGRPVVVEVTPNSAAAETGINPGDILLDVNRVPVYRAKEVIDRLQPGVNLIRLLRGNAVFLVYLRGA